MLHPNFPNVTFHCANPSYKHHRKHKKFIKTQTWKGQKVFKLLLHSQKKGFKKRKTEAITILSTFRSGCSQIFSYPSVGIDKYYSNRMHRQIYWIESVEIKNNNEKNLSVQGNNNWNIFQINNIWINLVLFLSFVIIAYDEYLLILTCVPCMPMKETSRMARSKSAPTIFEWNDSHWLNSVSLQYSLNVRCRACAIANTASTVTER